MKKRFAFVVIVEVAVAAIGYFAINCVYVRTQSTTIRSERGVPCTVHVYKGVNGIYIASDDYGCYSYYYSPRRNESMLLNKGTYAELGDVAVQATRDRGGILLTEHSSKVNNFSADPHRDNGDLVLNICYPHPDGKETPHNFDQATLRIQ